MALGGHTLASICSSVCAAQLLHPRHHCAQAVVWPGLGFHHLTTLSSLQTSPSSHSSFGAQLPSHYFRLGVTGLTGHCGHFSPCLDHRCDHCTLALPCRQGFSRFLLVSLALITWHSINTGVRKRRRKGGKKDKCIYCR